MTRVMSNTARMYLYKTLEERHKDLYEEYGGEIYNLVNANGPGYLWGNQTWVQPRFGHIIEAAPKVELPVSSDEGKVELIPDTTYEQLKWENDILKSELEVIRATKFYKLHLIYGKILDALPIINKARNRKR